MPPWITHSAAESRLRTSRYSFLGREMAERLSMEKAEELLHRAIADFGRFYGGKIRLRVEERGMPLDVENFLNGGRCRRSNGCLPPGDLSVSLPQYRAYSCVPCRNMDAYATLCPERLSVLICEGIHQAIAKGFNPDTEQWYVSLLPRGQAKCEVRFEMTTEAAHRAVGVAERNRSMLLARRKPVADDLYELPPQPEAFTPAYAHEKYAASHCQHFHFIANELARALGTRDALHLLGGAMRRWGTWRGEEMRCDHVMRGSPLNVATFVTHHDDPAEGDAWIAENVTLTEGEHEREITRSIWAELFAEVG